MKAIRLRICAAAALVSFAPACAGGAGPGARSSVLPAASRVSEKHGARVALHFVIPGPHRHRRGVRGDKFVSPSTDGILVQVYPHGSDRAVDLIAETATDVSSGSAACGGKTGYPRTCTANADVPATPGSGYDLAITAYDEAPAYGDIPQSAEPLAYGLLSNVSIALGKNNAFTVYMSGIVSSLGQNTFLPFEGGTPSSFGIAIDPVDFDDNPISAGTKDPLANPIVISIAETGGSGHMVLSLDGGLGASTVTVSHSTDTVQVEYDGGGSVGYGATIRLKAGAVRNAGGAVESIQASPLLVSSSNPEFDASSLALHLKGNGDVVALQFGELDAPYGTEIGTATFGNCAAVASPAAPSGSAQNATFVVYGGSVADAGTGCGLVVEVGTGAVFLSLTNEYGGVYATPSITEYRAPTAASQPWIIAPGPDGTMWYTEYGAHKIGNIALGQSAADYSLGASYGPEGIAPGPDGKLWWTDLTDSDVGLISTDGTPSVYGTQNTSNLPKNIALGSDGAMWFTECAGGSSGGNAIGRILPSNEIPQETFFSLPTANAAPVGIAQGPDGNIWFTESAFAVSQIGKITPSGLITEIPLPTSGSDPNGITVGPDGALWFTESNANKIGRIPTDATNAGQVTEYSTGITGGFPAYITTGPDGALWFTEFYDNASGKALVGRITTAGTITEYPVPTPGSGPWGISAGPDGAIWFTEQNSAQIGRIALPSSASIRHAPHPARSRR